MKISSYKSVCVLLFTLLLSKPGISQDKVVADSLKQLLTQVDLSDSLRFEVLRKLAYADPNPVLALQYGRSAYDLSIALKDSLRQLRSLEMISANQRILGDKAESMNTAMQALVIARQLQNPKKTAALLANMGANLTADANYAKAIEFFAQSAEIYLELNDYYRLATIYVNIGETYRLADKLDSAANGFAKALAINDSIQNSIIEAYAIGNLGLVHSAQDKFDLAQTELNRSIELLTDLGDLASVVIYRSEIGQIHLKQGRSNKGIELIESAYLDAKSNGLKEQSRDLSKLLANTYAEREEFKVALNYHKVYQSYKDSLLNAENIRSIEQTVARFELDKKDAEIELQEANIASEVAQKRMILIVSILLILITIGIYLGYRNKLKTNKLLSSKNRLIQQQSDEKELLYREMHHRVKNNLQLISSIMGLNANNAADEETSYALRSSQSRMEAMTLIHNSLYGENNGAHINFGEYLSKLVGNLNATYFDHIDELKYVTPDIILLADDCIPIGLIINECVCNAVKYKSNSPVSIEIIFEQSSEETYLLMIKDNGPGLVGTSKGFGSELIETLCTQLGGTFSMQSSKSGTEITLVLNHLITINQSISA